MHTLTGPSMRWLSVVSLLLFVLIALLAWPPPSINAQGTPAAVTPTLSPEQMLQQANQALSEAKNINDSFVRASNDVSNTVNVLNTLFSFVQVAAIILGVLFALINFLGWRNAQQAQQQIKLDREANQNFRVDVRKEVQDSLAQMRLELTDAVNTEKARSQQAAQALEQRTDEEISKIREQGQRSIRAMALLELAQNQMDERNLYTALKTLQEAHGDDPANRAVNFYLGEAYIQLGHLQEGIQHLEQTKDDQGVYYPPAEGSLGFALRLQGSQVKNDLDRRNQLYAEAEQHFLSALKQDPKVKDINGESFRGALGGLYRRQNRMDEAIRSYEEAARVTPQNYYPVSNLASLHMMRGDTTTAQQYFRETERRAARQLDDKPSDYWARSSLITALMAIGAVDKAQKILEDGIDTYPSAQQVESLRDTLIDLQHALPHISGFTDILKYLNKIIKDKHDEGAE